MIQQMMASEIVRNNGTITVRQENGLVSAFPVSQFFPALDGTWLMVDWMPSTRQWFVTTQAV